MRSDCGERGGAGAHGDAHVYFRRNLQISLWLVCAVEMGRPTERRSNPTSWTTTKALGELAVWLESEGVKHALMEATGVYWKPVWHILSETLELVLGNARHMRNVPGRKSDAADAAWLADLLAHGLVRGSFVPPESVAKLRDLTGTRKQLVREQVRHVQRMQKVLEDANIKLSSVISNIMGQSGRAMLEAICEGDPHELVAFATTHLKVGPDELVEAMRGRITDHHRFELKLHLKLYDGLQVAIDDVDARLEEDLRPFRVVENRFKQIPGIGDVAAAAILSEIGNKMIAFKTSAHLVSWAGLCPKMDESAGKTRSTRTRHGPSHLKTLLIQCAWAAARTKNSYYRAQFHRIRSRRGAKKAAVAVAASILTAIWHMLTNDVDFKDLGSTFFDKRDEAKLVNRLTRRFADLGYDVQVRKLG